MNTALTPENSGNRPFTSDLEYLAAEVEWIQVRARRIEASRLLEEQDGRVPKSASSRISCVNAIANAERVDRLQADEDALRQAIDMRLTQNRSSGPGLGLDRLCQEHGLDDFDRYALLLATLPCLGNRQVETHLWPVNTFVTSTEICPDTLSVFLEMSPGENLKNLIRLLPDAPLRRWGLVRLSYEPLTPAEVINVGFSLSGKTLAAITGIPGLAGFVDALPAGVDER